MISLGWKPADDDDAEDADAGDDADVRFRLFFCRPRKANTAACPAAQLDVAATNNWLDAYVIIHASRADVRRRGAFGGGSSTSTRSGMSSTRSGLFWSGLV